MTIKDIKLQNVGLTALLGFIFFVPIFYFATVNMGFSSLRIGQEQAFQMGLIIIYAIAILNNIYLGLFICLSVALYACHDFSGGNYLTNIFYACLLYEICYRLSNKENIEKIFKTILWLCILNIAWIILQHFKADLIFVQYTTKSFIGPNTNMGLMGLKCFMGMLFAICLPIALYYNRFVGCLFLIPIYLSESSICFVAAGITILIEVLSTLFRRSKALAIVLALIVSVAAVAYTLNDAKANMMTDRFNLWKVTLRDAFKHPVKGWGLDSFRNISACEGKDFMYFKDTGTNQSAHGIFVPETGQFMLPKGFQTEGKNVDPWDNAHNEYVQLFFEFGIGGVILLIFFAKDIFQRFVWSELYTQDRRVKYISMVFLSYAVLGTAQFPMHVVRNGIFLPIMLGIFYKITDEKEI